VLSLKHGYVEEEETLTCEVVKDESFIGKEER